MRVFAGRHTVTKRACHHYSFRAPLQSLPAGSTRRFIHLRVFLVIVAARFFGIAETIGVSPPSLSLGFEVVMRAALAPFYK